MLSKVQIKFIQALKQKKFRDAHKLFIAEGEKIVLELVQSDIQIKQIYVTKDFFKKTFLQDIEAEYIEVSEKELEQISLLTTPNKILAVCDVPTYDIHTISFVDKLTLVLDGIRDPGNLGTIIRIADWFGIENIICSNDTVEAFNPKVVQATMGSIARVKLHYTDLLEFLKIKRVNMPVMGALLEGKDIYSMSLPTSGFIIIGNEAKGVSQELFPHITYKLSIPNFSHVKQVNGQAESLNAAIATAIICSEFRRNG